MQGHKSAYTVRRMTTLAVRIKQARKHAGLTQKALAEAIGVSQPVISQLENGENLQSVHLLSIAKTCGVRPEWLTANEGDMTMELTFSIDRDRLSGKLAPNEKKEPTKLGPRLLRELTRLGWSEGELSKRSGVPEDIIHRMVKGDFRAPRNETVQSLAAALGVGPLHFWSSEDIIPEVKVLKGPQSKFPLPVLQDERFIVIPRLDIAASMGPGIVVPEHLEVIQQLVVDREWIREQRLIHTGVPNLAIITGFGDSMLGTFSDGDPLMVDRGVNSMDKDGIYVFSVDGAAHIKRLQRIGGSRVKVISDNPTYDRWEADLADIMIHARVLIGLNVRKME